MKRAPLTDDEIDACWYSSPACCGHDHRAFARCIERKVLDGDAKLIGRIVEAGQAAVSGVLTPEALFDLPAGTHIYAVQPLKVTA